MRRLIIGISGASAYGVGLFLDGVTRHFCTGSINIQASIELDSAARVRRMNAADEIVGWATACELDGRLAIFG